MHQQVAMFKVRQGPVAQPVDQVAGVFGVQDLVDGVRLGRFAHLGGGGQQVQVMVAQHRDRAFAKIDNAPQARQGLRAPVDQVAGEPELGVRIAGEFGVAEQLFQRRAATLHVAYHPDATFHAGLRLQGQRARAKRVVAWRYSIRVTAPSATSTAPMLGPSAVNQGGQRLSMPTLSASWFSMKKPTPSSMPINTFAPTPPRRVCMNPMGAAMVIITSRVNG